MKKFSEIMKYSIRGLLSLAVAAAMLCLAQTSVCAEDISRLPEISGWTCGEARVTQLDTISGNKGTWTERDYRTPNGTSFHSVLIEGSGAKGWNIPESVSADDGMLGSGATYKTVTAAGHKAVFEHHPVTGSSLAVSTGPASVLTLESEHDSESDLIKAAETLIPAIN